MHTDNSYVNQSYWYKSGSTLPSYTIHSNITIHQRQVINLIIMLNLTLKLVEHCRIMPNESSTISTKRIENADREYNHVVNKGKDFQDFF